MSEEDELLGLDRYYHALQELQQRVLAGQRDALQQVAERMERTVRAERRIFLFGTGHSHLLAEEGFYRAGGLATVVPIFSSALMVHEHPQLSSRLERTPGLAGPLLDAYDPQPEEMLFIFSNSGVNRLPVEMALEARAAGLFVVGVTALAYARVAPLSDLGRRLDEVVDVVLDNGGEPGDALVAVPDSEWRVGPSSTIVGALLWNGLVVEVVHRLQAAGEEAPLFASVNMAGAAEHNRALLEKWRGVNRHL